MEEKDHHLINGDLSNGSIKKRIDFPLGAVLLDLDEKELPNIATRVVDSMVAREQIPLDQRDAVIKILLLRHKHIKESVSAFRRASRGSKLHLLDAASEDQLPNSQSLSAMDRRASSVTDRRNSRKGTLSNIFHVNNFGSFSRRSSAEDVIQNGGKAVRRQSSFTQIDLDDTDKVRNNLDLMKKIPEGAEATAVLVGAVDFLKQPTIAFVRLAEGVLMENVIEVSIPVRFIFVLLGPFDGELDYHEVGRCISTLMSDKSFHEVAYRAHSRGQLLTAINEFLNSSIVLPPADWSNKDLVPIDDIREKSQEMLKKNESIRQKKKSQTLISALPSPETELHDQPPPRDPLKREGKLFHGLIQDISIRYSKYLTDIKDGLTAQVLSATIFIFFASLSPSITFGGLYGQETDKYIGVGETLLVTSINGMLFALFAAQPLLIVGSTGPLMIFDMSLLAFCLSQDLDYLSIRVWVGIWMVVIGLIVAAFELVFIVKYFSRFTEEIFSTLVCLIFIYGAFENLANIFRKHPLVSSSNYMEDSAMDNATLVSGDEILDDNMTYSNESVNSNMTVLQEVSTRELNEPNTALLSMCLMLGTFYIAFKLKKFRNSKFLGRSLRRALGDFGVPIAIFTMVLLDYLIHDTYTDKLEMPKGLQPSNSAVRGWIINPFGVVKELPVWCMFAAGPAALLLFILIFLEENICHLILSKPERCLKKGSGFHLDLVLSCLANLIAGILGAPFMGPACVRTISHMSALTVLSSNVPPGESPKIVGCLEQRISGFLVALLVGLGTLLYMVLNMVPTSVLLGVFLYMGVSATAGIQLIERVILFFMPVKYHPNVAYVKKVKTWKMHTFTSVQVLMLVVLWVVKQSPASLSVPFILMLLIPIRFYLLPYIFSSVELMALDGTGQSALMESPDSEPDFYETAHDLPVHLTDDSETHTHQS